MRLSDLDRVGDDALHVLDGGRVGVLPHPADLSWESVVAALDTPPVFMLVVAPRGRMSYAAAMALQRAWVRHHDLPTYEQAHRLAYLIDRYHDDLELDVPDLRPLWQARRWRYLLNVIDHLPRTSWYARAVATDEEAAKVIAKRYAGEKAPEAPGEHRVPFEHWTPEVEQLTGVINELRALRTQFVAANSTTKPGQPTFVFGPESALQRFIGAAKIELAKARHARISAMLTPRPASTPEPGTLPTALTDD